LLELAIQPAQRDFDGSPPLRQAVTECVGQELVQDERDEHGLVHAPENRVGRDGERDVRLGKALLRRLAQMLQVLTGLHCSPGV
jgi:hypothetical protein